MYDFDLSRKAQKFYEKRTNRWPGNWPAVSSNWSKIPDTIPTSSVFQERSQTAIDFASAIFG